MRILTPPHRPRGARAARALLALFFVVVLPAGAAGSSGAESGARQPRALDLRIGGRAHFDHASYYADRQRANAGYLLRRLSVGVDGKLGRDWSFEVAYDFADDGAFKDAYLRYDGWQVADVSVGQFKLPFGLEELASSNDTSFIERALPGSAFAKSRRLGIGLGRSRGRHTAAAMAFGPSIDGDGGRGAGARATFAPVDDGTRLIHLGIAATSERPRGGVGFDTRTEARPGDVKLVDTGNIPGVTRIDQLGLEAAWQRGPLSLQSEWMRTGLRRDDGRDDLRFDGWYLAGSWVLTGGSREYRDGRFKGIASDRRGGAWELTTRYSHVDLDDGNARGGRQDNLSVGLNWYANEHLRIMANHIRVRSQRRGVSDDPALLLLRAQIAF